MIKRLSPFIWAICSFVVIAPLVYFLISGLIAGIIALSTWTTKPFALLCLFWIPTDSSILAVARGLFWLASIAAGIIAAITMFNEHKEEPHA
jgi:hypothetical protein